MIGSFLTGVEKAAMFVSQSLDPGGVLPYMGYIGMYRCEGYGFQAVYSRIYPGYQRFFSRAAGIFVVWPKADTSSAVGRSREKNLWHGGVYLFVEGRGSRVPCRGRGCHVEGRG